MNNEDTSAIEKTRRAAKRRAESLIYESHYEHFDEFHFAVAMFVVEEDEETIELEFEDAVSVMAGEKAFPCVNSDKI